MLGHKAGELLLDARPEVASAGPVEPALALVDTLDKVVVDERRWSIDPAQTVHGEPVGTARVQPVAQVGCREAGHAGSFVQRRADPPDGCCPPPLYGETGVATG